MSGHIMSPTMATTSPMPSVPAFIGTNIPWNKFGYDIGGGAFDASWFEGYFSRVSRKTNCVRFFLHADGRATPQFDVAGNVVRLAREDKGGELQFDRELSSLVEAAARHRLVLQICLWSFDMCRNNGSPIRSPLLSDRAMSLSYIEHALLPLLTSLEAAGCGGGRCLLEIMNEPEWCIDDPRLDRCPAGTCVAAAHMQRFVALTTAAIHSHSTLRVTVGSASLKWSASNTSDGRSVANLWSDAALSAAYDGALSAAAERASPPPPPLVLSCDGWCQSRYGKRR